MRKHTTHGLLAARAALLLLAELCRERLRACQHRNS